MSINYQVVFGLTADPIHLGHEQVVINSVQFLKEQGCEIESFLLVPVYKPNLIADKKSPKANFDMRFKMCEIVTKRLSSRLGVQIEVSDIERQISLETGGENYSCDTLKALNLNNGLFIVSADHFKGRWPKFRKWYQWQTLLKTTGLLIHQRPGNTINQAFIQQLQKTNSNVLLVKDKKSVTTSSTYIRKHCYQQVDLTSHLSVDIRGFIVDKRLYQGSN